MLNGLLYRMFTSHRQRALARTRRRNFAVRMECHYPHRLDAKSRLRTLCPVRHAALMMNRITPRFRDFAERLISVGGTQAKSSASKPPAVFTAIDELRPSLAQVVGTLGFNAVLSRALALANADVPWLGAVHVKPDGSLEDLDELEANVDPKDIAEGRVVLLAEFLSLLAEFIGERLVLQLVQQAMSSVSKDDLYFGEGIEREKK